MRLKLSKVLQVVAVASGIAVTAFTGCSGTSSYRMPGMDMFGWGKKKPADSSLASTNRSGLPTPPSSSTRPQPAPSYNQPPSSASSLGSVASSPTGPASTIGQAGGSPYPSTGQPSPTSTSQGFYRPDYPASTASQHQPGGGGFPSPQTPHGAPSTGTPWQSEPGSQYALPGSSHPGSSFQPSHSASTVYGQPATAPGTPNATAGMSPIYPNSGYEVPFPQGHGSHHPISGQMYGGQPAGSQWQQSPQAPYLPGSTARSTPYGTSDSLRVAEGPGIQHASFSGSGDVHQPAAGSVPGYPPGSTYSPGGAFPATDPVGLPPSHQSIYR
jgi:hypothetical protein